MFTGKVPVSLQSFGNLRFFNISGNSFLKELMPINNQLGYSSEIQSVNKLVPKRYIFAQANSDFSTAVLNKSNNSHSPQAPASSPSGTPSHKHKGKKKRIICWIVRFSAGILAGVVSGTIFSVLLKRFSNVIKDKRNKSGPAIFSPLIKAEELAFLEEDEAVTTLQIIGKGGCGEVYKAELPEGKIRTIAVKKIVQPLKDTTEITKEDTRFLNKKMQQIKSEIQTVGHIRHRNLLPLLAHISQPNCHYLVYEFVKNGSLQDILQQVKEGSRELNWLARHKIALGVAAGLEYLLHTSHTPRIVHRDLKPANILLDENMEARISDFGLAKSIPDVDTHISGSNVAGTLGYIAPEYHQTMKFTDKSDMYSFGILLAVLVMGKLPSDNFFQHTPEMSLVKWMRNVMNSEDPRQAIDSKLMGNGYEEQILLVLKIACFCTQDNPKERPNSKDARLMLTQINY